MHGQIVGEPLINVSWTDSEAKSHWSSFTTGRHFKSQESKQGLDRQ